ncbi:hypothetical protein [Bradyrhizobium oligotrophicum]|uniref:hypothetical protein n=1 Tax=Bradyrhizobium oligotrophicum TaxID=44255 RepID=UPI003EBB1038
MKKLDVQSDGTVFGYTREKSKSHPPGGRTYKSLNYHRQSKLKPGKTIWSKNLSLEDEASLFDSSDFCGWLSVRGDLWWVGSNAGVVVGVRGERVAFFPRCDNHPGPWHGYPVAPSDDESYEIPEDVIRIWEADKTVDNLTAKRMRRGKI